jgi:hypothetical protein
MLSFTVAIGDWIHITAHEAAGTYLTLIAGGLYQIRPVR